MSQAKALKLKEYGTDILSHNAAVQNVDTRVRANDTFKSNVMASDEWEVTNQRLREHKSRERIFMDKPLTSKVQRASYQDSNIFGYKSSENPTVQDSAARDDRKSRTRYNATFHSRVFNNEPCRNETERPPSGTRKEEKWQSTVFDGPIVEQSRRKKLGQNDAGVETLFGRDKIDFDNKSNNMNVIGVKKQNAKQWKPVRQQKTAEQRKNEELYGRSAAIYGTGKKGDGTLMANGADWRNLQQTHINSPVKQMSTNNIQPKNSRESKFQNLKSNILCHEDKEMPLYNPDTEKANFGTDANWTAQAGTAKIINKGVKVDTYKKKQQQLASQVFEATDYSEYVPMKKTNVDFNNMADKQRKNDHLYSDILGAQPARDMRSPQMKKGDDLVMSTNNWSTTDLKQQLKKDYTNYSTKDQKHSQLKSALDTHSFEPDYYQQQQPMETPEKTVMIPGKASRATKVRDLSSDILYTGSTIQRFNDIKATTVVDLDLKGLPENAQADDLKKLSGVKHVIQATVDQDAIRNVCTGTGRLKMRLTETEDLDIVKLQFLKAGYAVNDHSENPKKKSNFTVEQTLQNRSPSRQDVDAKMSKVQNLQSSNPATFGNTNGAYQDKHNTNYDPTEMNKDKQAVVTESLAISSWNKVGGKR